MKEFHIAAMLISFFLASAVYAADTFESDIIPTNAGDLTITFIGHGSLMFAFGGKVIHVDPFSSLADYTSLPKADLVLITHEHPDHLDAQALEAVRADGTEVVANKASASKVRGALTLGNGDSKTLQGVKVEAVPAYNIVHERSEGVPFHPKGRGNGYVLSFADTKVYVAGDTENIPEMKDLGGVEIAFVPMNLPYTMTPQMAADAARMIGPKILYPYHYGETDTAEIVDLLSDDAGIEVRIRKMK